MRDLFRHLVAAVSALAVSACATTGFAQPAQLDPSETGDALQMLRKIQCSTVDNEPAIFTWHGVAYSRRQGERDRHLFNVEGMNIRACSAIDDEEKGDGFALVSRELLLYLDKDTGEVLQSWDNPWTGETLPVQQVANDPVNMKTYSVDRFGQPLKWGGDILEGNWWLRATVPLWYPNPLGGAYQAEVGGTYHASELFNFFGKADELLDPETTSVSVTVGWTRMADWLPWMKMNGRDGMIYFHTSGTRISDFESLSETMKSEIAAHYPEWSSPPPEGDARPNMTSWLYYKGVAEGSIEAPER